MIARSWSARASLDGAEKYADFFRTVLVPQLAGIEGHRGAVVLQHPTELDRVEITVLTFWDSMDAIARFAGSPPDQAVVEPEARAVLTQFDAKVRHHRVVVNEGPPRQRPG
jgi:heme-degrading monooxygenase HmoA